MKRKFTRLTAALALLLFIAPPLVGWGQTRTAITYTFSDHYTANTVLDGVAISFDDAITATFNKRDGGTATQYYTNGKAVRWYGGGTLDIVASDAIMTEITITFTQTANTISVDVGEYSDGTWTGSASSVKFTQSGTSGHCRISAIAVTYTTNGGGGTPTTYTVTYNANGGTGTMTDSNSPYNAGATVTVLGNEFTRTGYDFDHWNTAADDSGTSYDEDDTFTINANTTLYAQWTENTTPGGDEQWVLTNLADLTENDVFVIVGNNGSNYAMSNDKGTGSAPAAVAVTVANDAITGTVAANIQWNISGNATDGYTFYPNGSTETWLYCTNTNNGVRVGTNDNTTFKIADNYLKHDGTSRYVGIYNSSDWRCYTSINSNIQGQTFAFYKKVTGGVVPPSITANNVEIEYNVTEGAIEYTINNGVEGGSLSATTTSDWLTLGDNFTSPIAFTCSANAAATARTATVTLTYTYGDSQTATKNVTVTQTGDPNYTPTIAEVRAQGTGAVVTQGIVTSCVGTTGYIQDANAAICVYGESLTVGDEIRVSGTLSDYNGLLEITSPVVTVLSSGNNIEPELMTIAEVVASTNQGWYIRIENATVTAINGKNVTIAQGESNVVVRFASEDDITFEVNDVISLNGNIGAYNGVQIANPQNVEVQAAPAEPSITLISNDPVFTPNSPYTIEFTHESGGGTSIDQVQYENFSSTLTETDFSILFCDAEGNALTDQTAPDWILYAPSVTSESNNLYLGVTVNVNTSATAHTCYFKVGAANGTDMVYSDLVTVNQDGFVATITVNPTVVNATAAETDGTITVTYTNIDFTNAPEIVFYSDAEGTIEVEASYYADWFQAEINSDNNVDYLIGANDGEARTAYFKVYGLDIYVQDVYSDLVTINQAKYVVDYAELPFEFDGGRADIEDTNGLTQEGLDSDYGSSPKLKFNTTGDWVILKINERPGTLTFDIKGNSFSGSTFTVQTSEDGETYTDLENYTSITGTQSEEFDNLGENVRYIKWIYTEKSSGNVALGNITLAEYVLVPSITVEPDMVEVDAAEHDGTLDLTYENLEIADMTDFAIQYYDANGEELTEDPEWIEVTVAAQDPQVGEGYVVSYYMLENDGEARAAYFKVFVLEDEDYVYSNLVTVTQDAAPAMALYSYSINGVEGQTIVAEMGATIILDNGENLNDDFTFAGWTTDANDVSLRFTGEYTLSDDVTVFYAVYKREGTVSVINTNTENFPTTYGQANIFKEYTLNGKQFMIRQAYINNTHVLQFRAAGNNNGTGTLYNNESLGTINSIVLNYNPTDTKKNFTVFAGTNANPTDGVQIEPAINDDTYTFDLSNGNYSYFVMTNGENAGYLNSITINATNCSADYYTRVFLDETLTGNYTIAGPSIIPAGKYLDTDGKELNSTDADNFLIEEGGQLRHTGLGGVQVTMQKSITGYSNYEGTAENGGCWNLIAIPLRGSMSSLLTPTHFGLITDELGSEATPETSTYDLYKFSSDGGGIGGDGKEWRNYRQPQVQNGFYIEPNMGYLYANKYNKAFSFQGAVDYQNGDVSVSDGFDWMLYGNPFPCDAYIILESGEASFYRMNDAGDDFIAVQGAIKPLEGVFVLNSGYFKFSRTAPVTTPGVNVNVNSGSQVIDRAIVSFGHGNMLPKRMLNENNTKLYIPQGTQDYAVVNAQSEGEMPVSFKASKNGTYTISVEPKNVEMTYLHLIDNRTGADVDLLATPSYTFEANTTDYASRFRLVFSANNENGASTGSATFAYYNGSEWVISNMGEATLQVVDVMGRVLSTETVNGNAAINLNQTPGVYMFRLVNGDSVKVQKVVVR